MEKDILAEVERFLSRTGMALSTFGRNAVGDPSLVKGLRDGRKLWPQTEAKIRYFMTGEK